MSEKYSTPEGMKLGEIFDVTLLRNSRQHCEVYTLKHYFVPLFTYNR